MIQIQLKPGLIEERNRDGIFSHKKITPLVRVFGGAIRDIINNDPINDIDILVGPQSIEVISNILINHGYIVSVL